MAVAGRVAIVPKGDFDIGSSYERLDMVFYEGNSYVAKKDVYGIYPVDTEFWMQSTDGAKSEVAKTDNITIITAEDGTISAISVGFTGTKEEADEAIAKGEVQIGSFVNITDDYEEGDGGDNGQTYNTLEDAQAADAEGKIPEKTTVYILND